MRRHSENQKAPVLLPDLQAIIRLQILCHQGSAQSNLPKIIQHEFSWMAHCTKACLQWRGLVLNTILQLGISTLDLTLSILAERDSNPYHPVTSKKIQGIMEIFGWKSLS